MTDDKNRADQAISSHKADAQDTLRQADNAATGSNQTTDKTRKFQTKFQLPDFEHFEILEVLGRGGMGIVYRAHDKRVERDAAIKTLLVEADNEQTRGRLDNEAKLLARLNHPGLVQLYEFGYVDSPTGARVPYFAMEFIDGPSLDKFAGNTPVRPRKAAELVHDLAKTLAFCHENGIVHRDIKPGNILMASPVEPKLTDFGLGRLTDQQNRMTRTGEILGTPSYMSPEQASGVVKNIGPRSDIYGLGAILYELLTGRPPFSSPDPVQTMMEVLTADPAPPSSLQPKISRDLETIVLKCLEKKPKHRYESCTELASDLQLYLRKQPIQARRTPFHRVALARIRRNPITSTMIGVLVVGILAAFTAFSLHIRTLQTELDRSQRIIKEGRDLSRWLLDDFTTILENPDGTTYVRSQLADRTQIYLNNLLRDAAEDDALKTDIAYAFDRLAAIQGQADSSSLAQTEAALANLDKAEQLIRSLKNPNTSDAQNILAQISIQRIGHALAKDNFDAARTEIDELSELVKTSQIESIERLGFSNQLAVYRFEIAFRLGEQKEMESQLNHLKSTADKLISMGAETGNSILALTHWARCSEQFLEPQQKHEELITILKDARKQIKAIAGEKLSLDTRNVLANLDTKLGNAIYRTSNFEAALDYYQAALENWQSLYETDRKNQIAQQNVALSWQNIAETELVLHRLDDANHSFEQAKKFYEIWLSQRGENPDENHHFLFFIGSKARLTMMLGNLDRARQENNQKIDGLRTIMGSNSHYRRALGDALVIGAIIEAQICGNEFLKANQSEDNEFDSAYSQAVKAIQNAIKHFEAMDDEGQGSEATRSQIKTMQNLLKEIEQQNLQYSKLRGF